MRLESLTRPELIFPDVPGADARSVLTYLAEEIAARERLERSEDLVRRLWEREQLGSTGIGSGVAIPHCKVAGLDRVVLAVGISHRGIDFAAVDGEPVRLFLLVVSPTSSPAEHLQSLAAISKWVKSDRHVERILELDERDAIFDLLARDEG